MRGENQRDVKRVKPNATCAADGWSSEASVSCRQQKHPERSRPPPCHCGQADVEWQPCHPLEHLTVHLGDVLVRMHTLVQCQPILSLLLSRWCPQRETWVGADVLLGVVALSRWFPHTQSVACVNGAWHDVCCKWDEITNWVISSVATGLDMLFEEIIGWISEHLISWWFLSPTSFCFLPLLVTLCVLSLDKLAMKCVKKMWFHL